LPASVGVGPVSPPPELDPPPSVGFEASAPPSIGVEPSAGVPESDWSFVFELVPEPHATMSNTRNGIDVRTRTSPRPTPDPSL
jgi:hypothetical protein